MMLPRISVIIGRARWVRSLAAGVAILGPTLSPAVVHAAELQVREARAIATVPGQPVAAAYLVLSSNSDGELVSMSSDAARRVELHRMQTQDGIMRMRRVHSLALRAGETVRFAPGGMHLMLVDLIRPLQAGQQIQLELTTIDRDGTRSVTRVRVPVVKERPQ